MESVNSTGTKAYSRTGADKEGCGGTGTGERAFWWHLAGNGDTPLQPPARTGTGCHTRRSADPYVWVATQGPPISHL